MIAPDSMAGIGAGLLLGLLIEWRLLRARLRALATLRPVLPLILGGFLARLSLLLGGTLLGQAFGFWSPVAFLLSCLTAILLGEAYAFWRILRHRRSSDTSSST